jgi:hypothetical protein
MGVSNERVRQLEASLQKRIWRRARWPVLLASKLEEQVESQSLLLPLSEAEAMDPWFDDISRHPHIVRYFARYATLGRVDVLSIDAEACFKFFKGGTLLSKRRFDCCQEVEGGSLAGMKRKGDASAPPFFTSGGQL